MPSISGVTKDANGNPCAALVRVIRRADMSLVEQVFSNASTGAYSVTTADTSPHILERYVAPVGDLNAGYRRLGLHMAGANGATTFTDVGAGRTVTVNGAAKVDAVTTDPYGGTSGVLSLATSADYLSVADAADLELGSSNFSIRFKMKTTSGVAYACPLGRDNGSFPGGAWAFLLNAGSAGILQIWNASYSTGAPMLSMPSGNVCDNAWHDVEWTRNGLNWYLLIDGISVATVTSSITIADAALGINVGRDPGYSREYTGKLKDVEILIGKALHTANFTPPASTFIDYVVGAPTENAQIFDYVTPV